MFNTITILNSFSNLLLVVVTFVYVVLTWRMVKEMRSAREAENMPYLVATLIPLGALHTKLRIHNAGQGPALNIKAIIQLEPSQGTEILTWIHPVLLPNAYEDFRPPGINLELNKLATEHEKLIVQLEWHNPFKKKQSGTFEIDLKSLEKGWTNVGFLLRPEDMAVQLGRIKEELHEIRNLIQRRDTRELMKELQEQLSNENQEE